MSSRNTSHKGKIARTNNGASLGHLSGSLPGPSSDNDERNEVSSVSIMDRIMQIREYLKQATALKKQLTVAGGGAGDNRQNYEQLSKISSLISHLKEQEMGYLSLLSQLVGERDARMETDSVADTMSINLEVQSELNDTSQNNVPGQLPSRNIVDDMHDQSGRSSAEPELYSTRGQISVTRSRPVENGAVGGATSELQELKRQHELLEKLLDQQRELKDLKTKHHMLRQLSSNVDEQQNGSSSSALDSSSMPNGPDHPRRQVPVVHRGQQGSSGVASDHRGHSMMPSELVEEKTSLQNELKSLLEEKAFLTQLLKLRANGEGPENGMGTVQQQHQNSSASFSNDQGTSSVRSFANNPESESVTEAESGGGDARYLDVPEEELERIAGLEQQMKEKRELESRLRELQDKKNQMDQLVKHLQALKDASLGMGLEASELQNSDYDDDDNPESAEIEEARRGGADSADDPASQNSEHSGIRYMSASTSAAHPRMTLNRDLMAALTNNNDTDSDAGNEDEDVRGGAGVRSLVRESDHRTSSEMIADLMDSEERMRKLQEYQSRLQQMKTLVDMYQTAAANPRVLLSDGAVNNLNYGLGSQVDDEENEDEDADETLGAVGGVAGYPQGLGAEKTSELRAKIEEIERLKNGIEQLQGLISNVQSSTRQITDSQMSTEDQSRLSFLLNHRSDDPGLNERLDHLRVLLQAAGSDLSPEQLLMSDNDLETQSPNRSLSVDRNTRKSQRNEVGTQSSRTVPNSTAGRSASGSAGGGERTVHGSRDVAAIVPSQREVEGSVDSPTTSNLVAPSLVSSGVGVPPPQLSGQQLKSNKEMWLEMRQQRMQREEAKNRARGRFGDGQSEDSIQDSSDPFRWSISTTSATYGGSPVVSGPGSRSGDGGKRFHQSSSRRNKFSMDSLVDGVELDEDEEESLRGVINEEAMMMMQQAEEEEEEEEEDDEGDGDEENAEDDDDNEADDDDSTTSNETYTLEDLNRKFQKFAAAGSSNYSEQRSSAGRSQTQHQQQPVTLMPDNRKTDNRVAASRASAPKTKNSWTRNPSRQRKQENISTVSELALNSSQMSSATSSTMVAPPSPNSPAHNNNNNNNKSGGQRSEDVRNMLRELRSELGSTNEMVRRVQSQILQRTPADPANAFNNPANNPVPAISAPPFSANPGVFGGTAPNPMEDMMRSMEFMMRQQMMLQMSTMYNNMTMAWNQNSNNNNIRYPGAHFNTVPWAMNNPVGPPENFPGPPVGFMTPQMVNPWFPMDAGVQPQLPPANRYNNPYLSDEASIHSLPNSDQNRFSTSNHQAGNTSMSHSNTSHQFHSQRHAESSPERPNQQSASQSDRMSKTSQQNLSKSWPASGNPAGNGRVNVLQSNSRSSTINERSQPPEVPPLGLASESTSVDSGSDFFVQTYPNVDRSRRFLNTDGARRHESTLSPESVKLKVEPTQSTPVVRRKVREPVRKQETTSDAPMDEEQSLSLFDALRDNIYSELASVITENESRPHFLIELFRELKMLKTDYLRQRALMMLQDLVNRYIAEDANLLTDLDSEGTKRTESAASGADELVFTDLYNAGTSQRRHKDNIQSVYPIYLSNGRRSKYVTGEETPSDVSEQSAFSTQNEETAASSNQNSQANGNSSSHWAKKQKMNLAYLERMRRQYREQERQRESIRQQVSGEGSERGRGASLVAQHYDYEEVAEETQSGQSTPTFARDPLGDTAIYLDTVSAANRMMPSSNINQSRSNVAGNPAANPSRNSLDLSLDLGDAGGFESDSSFPDHFATPNINSFDTQRLDAQIKSIMGEVIPQLKSRMDETCSQSFLNVLRKQVLQLASVHYDGAEEFVRFFHQQLSTVLTEALNRFLDQTLRECGEDLLVEISEVLFNELAFFRMMRNFDGGTGSMNVDAIGDENYDDNDEDESGTEGGGDEELGEGSEEVRETDHGSATTTGSHSTAGDNYNREAEELSNERDDQLAMAAPSNGMYGNAEDEDDDDEDIDSVSDNQNENDMSLDFDSNVPSRSERQANPHSDRQQSYSRPLMLSEDHNSIPMLSLSETRALISYGSGEDDDEDEVVSQDELLAAVEEQTAVVTTGNHHVEHVTTQPHTSKESSSCPSAAGNSSASRSPKNATESNGLALVNEIMNSMVNGSGPDEMIEDNAPPDV